MAARGPRIAGISLASATARADRELGWERTLGAEAFTITSGYVLLARL